MLGDRGYANPQGVRHVRQAGGEVVVRLNRQALPLCDERGKALDAVQQARGLRARESGEWAAWVKNDSEARIPGRLLAVRRSQAAAEEARRRLERQASRKQVRVSEKSREAAEYFFLWTSLPSSWVRPEVLELYRSRWQIELAFKRMKSLMGLGHLPKKDPDSCRAWLHGKLFTSLLVEALIGAARTVSPWGYELGRT